MPDIYTSHLGRLRALETAGMLDWCVPIMRHPSDWLFYAHPDVFRRTMRKFAPSHSLLACGLRAKREGRLEALWPEYRARYLAQVQGLNITAAAAVDLLTNHAGATPVLLCSCASSTMCHRHALADWLREGWVDVEEWEPPVVAAPPSPQGSLF